jgi:hypothetical protein
MRRKLKYLHIKLIFSASIAVLLGLGACISSPIQVPDSTSIQASEPVQEPPTRPGPTELIPRITIEELLQKMDSNANILVIDTRDKEKYDVDHIKGAISAPVATITEGGWTPPSDKELILYCG